MNYNLAKELLSDFRLVRKVLNETIWKAKRGCAPDEYEKFRRAVGVVMGELFAEVVNPLYYEHPSLEPAELKQPRRRVTSKRGPPNRRNRSTTDL